MNLKDLLAHSVATPNVDVDCFDSGADLSSSTEFAVFVDSDHKVKVDDPVRGLYAGDQPTLFLGFSRNAATDGYPSIVRISGFVQVIYGGDVEVGNLLQAAGPGKEGRVVAWVPGKDGHVHSQVIVDVVHYVSVVDDSDAAVVSLLKEDFDFTLDYDDGVGLTSIDPAGITFEEISGGEYRLTYTPEVACKMHRLRVRAHVHLGTDQYIVTPSEFQDLAPWETGPPTAESTRFILGQAVLPGVDGDRGVMLMRAQIF